MFLIAQPLVFGQEKSVDETKPDSTESRALSINAYPYVYYTPETELAFGVGGIMVFYTADDTVVRPSKVVLGGYYSTKAQYKVTLDPAFYFNDNKMVGAGALIGGAFGGSGEGAAIAGGLAVLSAGKKNHIQIPAGTLVDIPLKAPLVIK